MNATLVNPNTSALARLCEHYHIRRLSLFGSALRDALHPDSDIDLLVEFPPDHVPGLFTLARIERELSPLFNDRRIDLRTAEDLSRYFREDVVKSAELLYGTA